MLHVFFCFILGRNEVFVSKFLLRILSWSGTTGMTSASLFCCDKSLIPPTCMLRHIVALLVVEADDGTCPAVFRQCFALDVFDIEGTIDAHTTVK